MANESKKDFNKMLNAPTAGIFPFWRVLQAKGELNHKFPEYPALQKKMLKSEGFKVVERRGKFYVADFEKSIYYI